MNERVSKFRHYTRTAIDRVEITWQNFIRKYPAIISVYMILSWVCVIVFLISLFVFKDSRRMSVQFLWSFYVILQLWFLCRSKTLTWKQYTRFFMAGAWITVPLTAVVVLLLTKLFGGSTSDFWSMSILTPIVEEVLKLVPLGLYLFLSRRASSLSLADFALIGMASGAGFQLMEEFARRIATGSSYGFTLLGGNVIHWDLFTLFPGYKEESFLPTQMTASHALITAMVALSIGIAIRLKSKLKGFSLLLPGFCLFVAILDHAVWNGGYQFPNWIRAVHKLLGSGYETKTWFLIMLGLSLFADYGLMNRVKEKLPKLQHEKVIQPFSEMWHLLIALGTDRKRYGYLLHFYRERRELAFTYIFGNNEAKEYRLPKLTANMEKYYQVLALLAASVFIVLVYSGWGHVGYGNEACFACLFDSLQNWWDRLSGWEKGVIISSAFALTVPFLGVWSAFGAISTGVGFAASGKEFANVLRNPKKLLTPEYAAASLIDLLLRGIPFGKAFSKKVGSKSGSSSSGGGPNKPGKNNHDGKEFSKMPPEEQVKIAQQYSKRAPIEIPESAKIKAQSKTGYEQISYKWNDGTYKYEVRWHTRTPGAPENQGNTWVVQRTIPGSGGNKPKTFFKIGEDEWIEGYKWYDAIAARKAGTATPEQISILDRGHWKD